MHIKYEYQTCKLTKLKCESLYRHCEKKKKVIGRNYQ